MDNTGPCHLRVAKTLLNTQNVKLNFSASEGTTLWRYTNLFIIIIIIIILISAEKERKVWKGMGKSLVVEH